MTSHKDTILLACWGETSPPAVAAELERAGFTVRPAPSETEVLRAAQAGGISLVLMDTGLPEERRASLIAGLKGASATATIPVIVLSAGTAADRANVLDLGADDALPAGVEALELLAHLRARMRAQQAADDLRKKVLLAEQGQDIAHTAFEALAVTEKMSRDATLLDRRLRIGVAAALLVAAAMAAVFFLYSRRADKETRRAYAAIAQLERGAASHADLVAEVRKMREELAREGSASAEEQKQLLEKHAEELRTRLASGDADVSALRRELGENRTRLRRIESEAQVAQSIIRSASPSVCLLHVVVVFRDRASGQLLRYAGTNPQGQPLQDSDGNVLYTLNGRGPEVHADFFGSGFIAASGGRILTNHHVVEPWWKSDELKVVAEQNLDAVISKITAYFPGQRRGFHVEVSKISSEADLAVVQGDLSELKRSALSLDAGTQGAISGQPLVSVGYATGLAAILARAGEDTVESILKSTGGNPSDVMTELARRDLIRPLTTQGHIGDVLPDKLVYDAQTTSGGSGGPLFNQEGKVIGVTFAVIKGFGGSNFGVPIRYALPLLKP